MGAGTSSSADTLRVLGERDDASTSGSDALSGVPAGAVDEDFHLLSLGAQVSADTLSSEQQLLGCLWDAAKADRHLAELNAEFGPVNMPDDIFDRTVGKSTSKKLKNSADGAPSDGEDDLQLSRSEQRNLMVNAQLFSFLLSLQILLLITSLPAPSFLSCLAQIGWSAGRCHR